MFLSYQIRGEIPEYFTFITVIWHFVNPFVMINQWSDAELGTDRNMSYKE